MDTLNQYCGVGETLSNLVKFTSTSENANKKKIEISKTRLLRI
jgi:hypothetical protein